MIDWVQELEMTFPGAVATGHSAAASAQKLLWSAATKRNPAAVVTCKSVEDVQLALRLAAHHRIPVSVLGGGHDWAGRAMVDNGLALNLQRLSGVSVDTSARTATVSGGALTRNLVAALPDTMAAVTGTISTIGVTGLTIGGGYGRLISRFGLALDTVRSAKVVLAGGSLVVADSTENTDLFWALRGGGGNFGVLTELTMNIFEVPTVTSGMLTYSLGDSEAALLRVQDILDSAPDELGIFSGFCTLPTGMVGLFLQPLIIGESTTARAAVDELCRIPGTEIVDLGEVRFRDTFNLEAEKMWPHGLAYKATARNLKRLDRETIPPLMDIAKAFPTPSSAIVIHDFHGLASRIPPEATAFPCREDHFNVELIAGWDTAGDAGADGALRWLDHSRSTLDQVAMPGGYANLLGPEEAERSRQFYAPALERLSLVKRAVDPLDLFRSNTGHL